MPRLIALAILAALLPSASLANCSNAEMRMCIYVPLDSSDQREAPCAYSQCATGTGSFDFYRFEDGATARIDYTSDTGGTFSARLGQIAANARTDYDALPLEVVSEVDTAITYDVGTTFFFASEFCGPACDGLDAEAFGE